MSFLVLELILGFLAVVVSGTVIVFLVMGFISQLFKKKQVQNE